MTPFERWVAAQSKGAHYPASSATGYAEQGWNARQPEIDLLTRKLETARASDPSRMKQPGMTRGAAWNPEVPDAL